MVRGEAVKIRLDSFFLASFILLVYVVGFVFQFLGILSITETNIVALLLLFFYLCLGRSRVFAVRAESLFLFFVLICFYVLGFLGDSSIVGYVVYSYYFSCVFLVIFVVNAFLERYRFNPDRFFFFCSVFLFVQILVCVLQVSYSAEIVSLSKTVVSIEDTVSGTFYLASDATLAFFCTLLNIAAFATNQKRSTRLLLLLLTAVVVYLTNSKASHLLFLLVVSLLLICAGLRRLGGVKVLFMPIVIAGGAILIFLMLERLIEEAQVFLFVLQNAYETRFSEIGAHRLAPIGQLIYEGVNFFGSGFLTYFDPIRKEWLYYSGFSLFYSFYIDVGFLGVILFFLYIWYFIYKGVSSFFYAFLYFFSFSVFSFFNFAITDLAALFALFFLTRFRGVKC